MSFWSNLFGGGSSRKAPTARRPQQHPSRPRPPASTGGSPATRTCTDCGAAFPQSTTFCPRCGKTFGSTNPAPARPGESIAKAVQLYNEGKVEEAVEEAKRLIELNPKHATAHGSLGYFLLEERRFDEAVDPMLRALELNPNSKETALHLRDVIDAYAEELIGIASTDGFVSEQGGENFDEQRRHRRTRQIGETLARIGDSGVFGESGEKYTSEKLMTKVHSEVQVRMSFRPETNALRPAWEGIGGWKV
jgi:hypothetical protein